MGSKYQPGLDNTKGWLKKASLGEITEVLEKSGLSRVKMDMILRR